MFYDETLFSSPYCTIPFTLHTNTSDKQLGAFVSHNNKPIVFFSRRFSNPQRNYTTDTKELLTIVEFKEQFQGFSFDIK